MKYLAAILGLVLASCAPVPRAIIPPASVVRELNTKPVEDASRTTRDAVREVAAANNESREAGRKVSDATRRLSDSPEKIVISRAWNGNGDVLRHSPTVSSFMAILDPTEEQVDDMFRRAATFNP